MDNVYKIPLYVKISLISVGLFAFISMLYIAQGLIVPIIYATIIAIVFSPVTNFFIKKKMNRVLAILLTITIMFAVAFCIVALIISQASTFSEAMPKLEGKFTELLHDSKFWVSGKFNIPAVKVDNWLAETRAEIFTACKALAGQALVNIGAVLVILVLIPVYIFMILFYQPLLIEFVHRLFIANKPVEVTEVLSSAKKIIQSYLIGLMLEALIVAALNVTALLLLGVEYAILLGVIGAMLNMIPYLGGIIAVTLPMLIALATNSPGNAVLVLAAYIFIQFIDNHIIIPNVVASKVKLNALVSIIVVLAGGALWGIPGMFLSIPLTAILKVVFDHVEGLKPWGYLLGNEAAGKPVALKKQPASPSQPANSNI
jgi:predicted PurR-regulated permease PerM